MLALIARGLSNAEIAEHLRLSLGTVKTHVGRLLAKLDARDRAQLVIVAYETGLVTVPPVSDPQGNVTSMSRPPSGRARGVSVGAVGGGDGPDDGQPEPVPVGVPRPAGRQAAGTAGTAGRPRPAGPPGRCCGP